MRLALACVLFLSAWPAAAQDDAEGTEPVVNLGGSREAAGPGEGPVEEAPAGVVAEGEPGAPDAGMVEEEGAAPAPRVRSRPKPRKAARARRAKGKPARRKAALGALKPAVAANPGPVPTTSVPAGPVKPIEPLPAIPLSPITPWNP